jgi:hypothetical protein
MYRYRRRTHTNNQYKVGSHRGAVLMVIRWQAVIFGISILYLTLGYFLNFGNYDPVLRILYFVGFASLLVIATVVVARRFKRHLPLTEHLIMSYNISLKVIYIAVVLLISFMIIPYIGINLLSKYSRLLSLMPYDTNLNHSWGSKSCITIWIAMLIALLNSSPRCILFLLLENQNSFNPFNFCRDSALMSYRRLPL